MSTILTVNHKLAPVNQAVKILVADDTRLQRMFLQEMLASDEVEVVVANDGLEAVELFKQKKPDLCLLDVNMPNLDGIGAAKQMISFLSEDEYVPIVFLTAQDNEETLMRCIDAKADDFIVKPFNPTILKAKINSLLKFKRLYEGQFQQKQELLAYQQMAEQEQDVAASIHDKIIHARFLETSNIRNYLSPMALFNGDIFLVAKTPGNQLHCLLGDFTGHGLSASIGASPTAEVFYGMVNKGFTGSEILLEINKKLHSLLPVHMFLAATLVTLDPDSRFINVMACGLPDHYLLNKKSGKINKIVSKNLPLGIVEDFDVQEQLFSASADDYLYLYTDGIIEAENKQGEQFDFKGIEGCLNANDEFVFDSVLQGQQQHCSGSEQQDDITLIEIQCDMEDAPWRSLGEASQYKEITPLVWKSSMEFDVKTLQYISPVPVMLNSIMEIQGLLKYSESIYMIISELFNNCVDHGLLGLDSKLRDSAEGFGQYYELRGKRLSEREGFVKVIFSHQPFNNGGRLTIRMSDSGDGFDYHKRVTELSGNQSYHNRGIPLVNSLCESLEYFGNGSQVKAVFEWACET
jgi:CheY-like chemotaxis protein